MSDECCPRFDPLPWDETEVDLEGKLFLKDRVRSFFHIPLNFGAVMKRDMALIEEAGAKCESQLILADEESLFGSNVYTEISKEIPGAKMAHIQGTMQSKVFKGPFSKMGEFIKEMKAYLQDKGKALTKPLFFYPLCPNCAKKYGTNYVVILDGGEDLKIQDL